MFPRRTLASFQKFGWWSSGVYRLQKLAGDGACNRMSLALTSLSNVHSCGLLNITMIGLMAAAITHLVSLFWSELSSELNKCDVILFIEFSYAASRGKYYRIYTSTYYGMPPHYPNRPASWFRHPHLKDCNVNHRNRERGHSDDLFWYRNRGRAPELQWRLLITLKWPRYITPGQGIKYSMYRQFLRSTISWNQGYALPGTCLTK